MIVYIYSLNDCISGHVFKKKPTCFLPWLAQAHITIALRSSTSPYPIIGSTDCLYSKRGLICSAFCDVLWQCNQAAGMLLVVGCYRQVMQSRAF